MFTRINDRDRLRLYENIKTASLFPSIATKTNLEFRRCSVYKGLIEPGMSIIKADC